MTIEILSAEQVSQEALCDAMNASFSDYSVPMHLSQHDFSYMQQQRGLDNTASRVALVDGQIAAIWLVSVRGRRAYLISSGTRPQFRRQGLARKLAADCLAHLRHQQIARFQTEVLTTNTRAFELYASLDMTIARTLECYEMPSLTRKETEHDLRQISWPKIRDQVAELADIEPSWQNSVASINAVANDVQCWSVFDARGLAGYAVLMPKNGTLAQIAVRKDRRREGIGSALLAQAHPGTTLRLLNIENTLEGLHPFLERAGARPIVHQYEMVVTL